MRVLSKIKESFLDLLKSPVSLALLGALTLLAFIVTKASLRLGVIKYSETVSLFEHIIFFLFCIPFALIFYSIVIKRRAEIKQNKYIRKLNSVLISQSRNELFYSGKVVIGAAILVQEVANALDIDRSSIWLYNDDRSSIQCKQLYIKSDGSFHQDLEIRAKDYPEYFQALNRDPIIVANDAASCQATACFMESYLKPLGIKSMLDVPIWHKGEVIGVICIESLSYRSWKKEEIDFAQLLSSMYSFDHSVKEGNEKQKSIEDFQNFVNRATLVSKADEKGRITYVNDKFTKVSGWTLEEALGKDHSILNSNEQHEGYWGEMYAKVFSGEIWNDVVANKTKLGKTYYVDTYIKATIDSSGKVKEFVSIRQDVTDIVEKTKELEKKNTYLEHAAKILRHDMHSGINTYIPRGISSLERRLTEDQIKELKLDSPLRMIKEGLLHTQKVYKGVYEFTNLVKKDAYMNRADHDLKGLLVDYLSSTAYKSQVIIEELGTASVNDSLFCTAIDNLIRNGLKYNDSLKKIVKISREKDFLIVEDNGRGMTMDEFKILSRPYARKEGQEETGTGLGLNICVSILEEHSFKVYCEKLKRGTAIKIKIN